MDHTIFKIHYITVDQFNHLQQIGNYSS